MTYQDNKAIYDGWFEKNFDRHVDELTEFVSIPTIGAEPEHVEDMQKGAQWIADKLTRIGMENATVHQLATPHPVVTAEWLHAEGQPTVLFYGHFDVQPVTGQPWKTDPFKPVIEGNRMYGRGATDCKGGLYMSVMAVEAIMANEGKLPVNVKFFFEGQEEIGSPSLMPWIGANTEWLAADYAYNTDAMNYDDNQGLMWKGLRGGAFVAFTIKGANRVLHSGIYGGVVPNANVAMAKIVASFHNADGTVVRQCGPADGSGKARIGRTFLGCRSGSGKFRHQRVGRRSGLYLDGDPPPAPHAGNGRYAWRHRWD
jgi:acetylornithine deacetylase/succinyl-diaminopimelate desuccinylase-like protein